MKATKEDCLRAMEALKEWQGSSASKTVVYEFLQAAEKRLPTAEAVERDRQRRLASGGSKITGKVRILEDAEWEGIRSSPDRAELCAKAGKEL